jgi:ketosteroid isomerase-like protein
MSSATQVVKAFYAALGRGDLPAVLDLLHPQIEWTEVKGFPYYNGTWRSHQEIIDGLLGPLNRDWDGFAATPHEFLSEDGRVISFGNYSGTAKSTGKQMRAAFAHRWEVQGEKITRFDMVADTFLVREALR